MTRCICCDWYDTLKSNSLACDTVHDGAWMTPANRLKRQIATDRFRASTVATSAAPSLSAAHGGAVVAAAENGNAQEPHPEQSYSQIRRVIETAIYVRG